MTRVQLRFVLISSLALGSIGLVFMLITRSTESIYSGITHEVPEAATDPWLYFQSAMFRRIFLNPELYYDRALRAIIDGTLDSTAAICSMQRLSATQYLQLCSQVIKLSPDTFAVRCALFIPSKEWNVDLWREAATPRGKERIATALGTMATNAACRAQISKLLNSDESGTSSLELGVLESWGYCVATSYGDCFESREFVKVYFNPEGYLDSIELQLPKLSSNAQTASVYSMSNLRLPKQLEFAAALLHQYSTGQLSRDAVICEFINAGTPNTLMQNGSDVRARKLYSEFVSAVPLDRIRTRFIRAHITDEIDEE